MCFFVCFYYAYVGRVIFLFFFFFFFFGERFFKPFSSLIYILKIFKTLSCIKFVSKLKLYIWFHLLIFQPNFPGLQHLSKFTRESSLISQTKASIYRKNSRCCHSLIIKTIFSWEKNIIKSTVHQQVLFKNSNGQTHSSPSSSHSTSQTTILCMRIFNLGN